MPDFQYISKKSAVCIQRVYLKCAICRRLVNVESYAMDNIGANITLRKIKLIQGISSVFAMIIAVTYIISTKSSL